MTIQYSDLPNFGDKYLQFFDPDTKAFHVRRRSRASGNISISEAMDLMALYLRRYQVSYIPNRMDKHLVMFPFMFIEPASGQQIRNVSTGEVYTIDQVVKNPSTGKWEGLLRLDLETGPSIEKGHKLEYLNFDNYVKFEHEFPSSIPNLLGANSNRELQTVTPMTPTVTWSLKVVEPGSFGKPFSSDKQWKSVLKEATKDPYKPGFTVEVYGQPFDNIIQFNSWSHDGRTSELLINWIDQFLRLYTGPLRQQGIQQMFFWKREQDSVNTTWRQTYNVRNSQWYFRTEELEAVYQRDILKVDVTLGTDNEMQSRLLNSTRYIADQKVSGLLSSEEYRALFYRSGEYLFGDLDIRQQ